MGRPRAFDWDEAKRLRGEGLLYREIGERLGVSAHSVACACDAQRRRRQRKSTKQAIEAKKEPCRGGCGVLVYMHYGPAAQRSGYCIRCFNERRHFEAEMRDSHGTESRYINLGCRCEPCRLAATAAKKRRRISAARRKAAA